MKTILWRSLGWKGRGNGTNLEIWKDPGMALIHAGKIAYSRPPYGGDHLLIHAPTGVYWAPWYTGHCWRLWEYSSAQERVLPAWSLNTDSELRVARSHPNNIVNMEEALWCSRRKWVLESDRLNPSWFHLLAMMLWISEPPFSQLLNGDGIYCRAVFWKVDDIINAWNHFLNSAWHGIVAAYISLINDRR